MESVAAVDRGRSLGTRYLQVGTKHVREQKETRGREDERTRGREKHGLPCEIAFKRDIKRTNDSR